MSGDAVELTSVNITHAQSTPQKDDSEKITVVIHNDDDSADTAGQNRSPPSQNAAYENGAMNLDDKEMQEVDKVGETGCSNGRRSDFDNIHGNNVRSESDSEGNRKHSGYISDTKKGHEKSEGNDSSGVTLAEEDQFKIPTDVDVIHGPYAGMNSDVLLHYSGAPLWHRLRVMLLSLLLLSWLMMLAAVIALAVIHPRCKVRPYRDWWQTAVIYRVDVERFHDSDGDGVGDLNGLSSRLDYIKSLGASAVSLSPFYEHHRDSTISVTNHTAVDPQYGTMKDFAYIINAAHKRGIKVIVDFIPNHTSDQHDWFKIGSNNSTHKHHKYYIWNRAGIPNNWRSTDDSSAWNIVKSGMGWYLSQTGQSRPDLNLRNANVQLELKNILEFWLDVGVDGFYIRHSEFLFEDYLMRNEPRSYFTGVTQSEYRYLDHVYTSGLPENNDMFVRWRDILRKHSQNSTTVLLLADISGKPSRSTAYYERFGRDGVHVPLNYHLMSVGSDCNARCVWEHYLNAWLQATPENKTYNWVIGGSGESSDRARALLTLSLLLPGVIYTESGQKAESMRTNMPWQRNHAYNSTNLDSTRLYRNLTALRSKPAFAYGNFHLVVADNDIIAYLREFDGVDTYMVVINLGHNKTMRDLTTNDKVASSGKLALTSRSDSSYTIQDVISNSAIELEPHHGIVVHWKYSIKQYT